MKTVILCGGEGTRLRELTESIPKALVDVGGKPILWHIMRFYSAQGFHDFILCLGYKKDMIIDYFKNNPEPSMNIEFVDTGEKVTKSERLKKIRPLMEGDNFLLAYGDDLSNVDINKVIEFHNEKNKIVTITTVNPRSDFGVIELDKENNITGFIEKPKIKNTWINGGFAVLNTKIFDYLNDGELEDEVYKKLADEKNICAYKHNGFWMGMNTFKDQVELSNLWNSGKHPWKVWKDE
tara:strand:+ start:1576 stop:2286 length:711 start_codon:yes stop_codon:yes gene_type:complete